MKRKGTQTRRPKEITVGKESTGFFHLQKQSHGKASPRLEAGNFELGQIPAVARFNS